jgi:hypothetical protein
MSLHCCNGRSPCKHSITNARSTKSVQGNLAPTAEGPGVGAEEACVLIQQQPRCKVGSLWRKQFTQFKAYQALRSGPLEEVCLQRDPSKGTALLPHVPRHMQKKGPPQTVSFGPHNKAFSAAGRRNILMSACLTDLYYCTTLQGGVWYLSYVPYCMSPSKHTYQGSSTGVACDENAGARG